MAYELVQIGICKNQKIVKFLQDCGYGIVRSQRLIDKGRIFSCFGVISDKSAIICGDIFIMQYVPYPKGLMPIFECDEFAIFDKPSGVLSHPNGRNCAYSLYDEIYSLYGESACVVHRLDKDTSGLILVAKDKKTASILKTAFENRNITKKYVALVGGSIDFSLYDKFDFCKISFDDKLNCKVLEIKAPLSLVKMSSMSKEKAVVDINGKVACTVIRVLEYFADKNCTLLECSPLTGRQHQIRSHLFHVKHQILGDTLYGIDEEKSRAIIDEELTEQEIISLCGARRLCLHASELEFKFKDKHYSFKTKIDYKAQFLESLKL